MLLGTLRMVESDQRDVDRSQKQLESGSVQKKGAERIAEFREKYG